ncbi:MAG: IS66 family transposase, partial [Lysobacterales bacterium]
AKALAVHLTQHHMLPLARTGELFGDIFGLPLTDAAILTMRDEAVEKFQPTAQAIKDGVLAAPVIHPDETGMRAVMKLHWLHVVATSLLTWMSAHAKRGQKAMDEAGILPHYTGITVHDCWHPYWDYGCTHSVCNAHIGRELVFAHEVVKQKWAKQMKTLLWSANRDVKRTGKPLRAELLARYHTNYDRLLEEGERANPTPPKTGKRGRQKRSKVGNLVARMKLRKTEIWRFATTAGVPFTNNLAEQAVRMPKVKQKVSGCFRTKAGLDAFCLIRSCLATVKKQGGDVLAALTDVFCDRPLALRMA